MSLEPTPGHAWFSQGSEVFDFAAGVATFNVERNTMNGAVMISDVRDFAQRASQLSPIALCTEVARISDATIAAVQSHGGTIHQHVAGTVVAYWITTPQQAFQAAQAALSRSGPSICVAVGFGDVAEVGGASGRTALAGIAYSRAEQVLRKLPAGTLGIDLASLPLLAPELRARLFVNGDYAAFRQNAQPVARVP